MDEADKFYVCSLMVEQNYAWSIGCDSLSLFLCARNDGERSVDNSLDKLYIGC